MVNLGGVLIYGGGSLGAEVAIAGIEVQRADVMRAVGAGELHTALDACDGVETFHSSSVVVWRESGRHGGDPAKVISREFQNGRQELLCKKAGLNSLTNFTEFKKACGLPLRRRE